jgi:N-carbamoyl-L-amino-acid hydrolase
VIDAAAAIARLRALDEASGGRRIAWTDTWRDERERVWKELHDAVPGLETERDPAGNLWARLPGESPDTVIFGSHLDCVPDGGWLDGCLGVIAGVEAMKAIASNGTPKRSVALVDWADEEGARFGHSLLGSSAASGLLDVPAAAALEDADGLTLAEAVAAHGVEIDDMPQARSQLENAVAYVELHIEQGPVLEEEDRAICAVRGCLGVRRTEHVITGRPGHAGATPMALRQDPLQAAAAMVRELRRAAESEGGLATVGAFRTEPGTPTAIPARVRLTTDIRHAELEALERLDRGSQEMAARTAAAEGCAAKHAVLWEIDPLPFDPALVERAQALTGGGAPLTSGPLHDAAAVCRAGVPTVMIFVRTRGGVSHSREEDAADDDLKTGIEAFGALVSELTLNSSLTT